MNPSLYTVESLQLSLLAPHYCISKVSGDQGLKDLAETGVLAAIVEPTVISVVHEKQVELKGCLDCEEDWRALRIQGVLDFTLTGILHHVLSPLAANEISVLTYSSYDTDYILIKNKDCDSATRCLVDAGFDVITSEVGTC